MHSSVAHNCCTLLDRGNENKTIHALNGFRTTTIKGQRLRQKYKISHIMNWTENRSSKVRSSLFPT